MNKTKNLEFESKVQKKANLNFFGLAVISLFALTATFVLAILSLDFAVKLGGFLLIVGLFFLLIKVFVRTETQIAEIEQEETEEEDELFTPEILNRLLALEEAKEFFGASLKPADMFRLVGSRINEITPFSACLVYLFDKENPNLKIRFADGQNAEHFAKLEMQISKGLAGKVFHTRKSRFENGLIIDKTAFMPHLIADFGAAAAVPLMRGEEVFGVLQIFGSLEDKYNENSVTLLEAISERVAPIFLSSMAFEKSLSNALTDPLTNLPNERAFFLVLENQIAETQRNPLGRPLAVLTIDLKDFAEINERFGHATGDRVLTFAGQIIKTQLRQMDFLARSAKDEFLVVLPTASEKIAADVIERISRTFITKPFEIDMREKVYLKLNFGAANFGNDGDTAPTILQNANLRKQQSKSSEPNKILWFSKETVN